MGVIARSFSVPYGEGTRTFSFQPATVEPVLTAAQVVAMESVVLPGKVFGELVRNSKIEVVHKDAVVDQTEAKNATGSGEWFWRWKQSPANVGRIFAFATPLCALVDGLHQEGAWRDHFARCGGSNAAWKDWHPGKAMPNNGALKPINEKAPTAK